MKIPASKSGIDQAVAGLRIAIISDAAGERNGVGSYYTDLAEALAPRMACVELIHPDEFGGDTAGKFSIPLPGDSTQRVKFPDVRALSDRISEIRPHLLIIPTPGPFGLAGAYLGSRYGAQVLIGFHTDYQSITNMYWHSLLGKLSKHFFHLSNRLLFHYGDTALINSPNVRASAIRSGARELIEVGTPLGQRFLTPPPPAPAALIQHIVFAGRLAEEKNLDAFLDAAQNLPDRNFYIAGDGPMRDKIVAAANNTSNLSYLGWLPRSRLPELIDGSDLLVLPSHVESFGTIALEAMARARSVLVSESCGIRTWPKLNACLYAFPPEEHLSDAILRVIHDAPAKRIAKAQESRRAASALHEETIGHWCAMLARATGRKGWLPASAAHA